jgi:hypothetical protein
VPFGRPHLPISRGMLFQKKRRQLLAHENGHVLPLRERHQLILVRFAKHPFKRLARAKQPALAKCFPILPTQK